jgi:S-adenosylmethionine synthetase
MTDELDKSIVKAVGQKSGSGGGGFTGRDLNFYFESKVDRDAAADRLSSAGLTSVSVVRREELDP